MLDPQNHYFPDFDGEAITSFARPFCRLMFAYADFDREIARLVSASTGKPSHEDTFRRGSVSDSGQHVEKFIGRHGGDVTEIGAIKELLSCAQKAYEVRNLLAHGHWWEFDPRGESVTIRRDRSRKNEDRFAKIMVDQIEEAISGFENVEAELFKVRRRIESRRCSDKENGK